MASPVPTAEFELRSPPSDGISAIKFNARTPSLLLAASWDKTLRLYDTYANTVRTTFAHPAPLLDACFTDGSHAISGSLDQNVRYYDLNSNNDTVLGSHDNAVRSVVYSPEQGIVLSGSWDKTVKLWDPRAPTGTSQGTYTQPERVYTMDVADRKLVVGTAGRHVYIYDVRNMNETLQKRESSLKYQTRAISCFPTGEGYALSSIEGRVAVEYFDPSPTWQAKRFAFKCHRGKVDGVETVYPVNAIAFHPSHGTFATGGSDGVVNTWDPFNKKRLRQFPGYPTSVSALAFSPDGLFLAIGVSYAYEEGEKDHPNDSIFIRPITDADTKPKTAAATATGPAA